MHTPQIIPQTKTNFHPNSTLHSHKHYYTLIHIIHVGCPWNRLRSTLNLGLTHSLHPCTFSLTDLTHVNLTLPCPDSQAAVTASPSPSTIQSHQTSTHTHTHTHNALLTSIHSLPHTRYSHHIHHPLNTTSSTYHYHITNTCLHQKHSHPFQTLQLISYHTITYHNIPSHPIPSITVTHHLTNNQQPPNNTNTLHSHTHINNNIQHSHTCTTSNK